jgi:leucine dehydrogenase
MTMLVEATSDAGLWGGTEELVLAQDRTVGLRAVIAIDDTTLGPGLGGVRWLAYPSEQAAVTEARRLARVMTLKNACADLPYGGAKSIILKDGTPIDRTALMGAFGRFVARLGGAYLPGVDMGTTVEDLAAIGRAGAAVSCHRQDPSPWTALGVFTGIAVALERDGGGGLAGRRVVIQGAGHVGGCLAQLMADAGARVLVADVDGSRAAAVAHAVGAEVIATEAVIGERCDVLAPCANARVIDRSNVDSLQCAIVAGGANDILADRGCADLLADRGITYVPDFVLNAGGVIQIHAERAGWDPGQLESAVRAIGERVGDVLTQAEREGSTPLAVAEGLASERLGRPITVEM